MPNVAGVRPEAHGWGLDLPSLDKLGQSEPDQSDYSALSRLGEKLMTTWPVRLAQSAWASVLAPGEVYAGRLDPNSDEGLRAALGLAGLAIGGASPFANVARAGEVALGSTAVRGGRNSSSFTLDYFGQPVKILQNPSPNATAGFLNRTKFKAARRLEDPETGDVFIWDGADPALHAHVAKELGVRFDPAKADIIGLD